MIDFDTRRTIDRSVSRLLSEAGARGRLPTPIEDLVAARRLQASTPESSPLSLTALARAPLQLQNLLRPFVHKVVAVLDRRERQVHVRPNDLEVQQRFGQCHEVGHDLCDWHKEDYFLDCWEQLDPRVHDAFEQEANYAAAELLFQQDLFRTYAKSSQTGMATVVDLANRFGGSIHAAFRLYVETSLDAVAGLVLRLVETRERTRFRVRQIFTSHKFTETFAWLDDPSLHLSSDEIPDLRTAWVQLSRAEMVGEGLMALPTRDGVRMAVPFELFCNTYNHFLLITPTNTSLLRRRVTFATRASR